MGLKITNPYLLFWTVLGALSVLLIWQLPWRFQVNDDVIMMWLVAGDYTGKPEPFAVFIHPILSWLFSKFYLYLPGFDWYPAAWFFTQFCAFVVFLKCFWKRNSDSFPSLIYSMILFALLIHFLFFLQFSIVSAFAIGAGLTARILEFKITPSSDSNTDIVHSLRFYRSDLMILLGSLIRIEVLFLMVAGLFILGRIVLKKYAVTKAMLLPSIVLVACFSLSQFWIHYNGLNDFEEANRLRSSVFDDPILQLNKDAYRGSLPDLYFFSNGLIDFALHPELMGKMEEWKDVLNANRFKDLSPFYFVKAFTYLVLNERYFCFLMGFLVAFSWINQPRFTLVSISVLVGIMIILSPFFLLKIQIYTVVLLVFLVISFLGNEKMILKKPISISLVLLLVGILFFHVYSFLKSDKSLLTEEEKKQLVGAIPGNKRVTQKYLIGWDVAGLYLSKEKPNGIRFLGWPSLLFGKKDSISLYLVERSVFLQNQAYFKPFHIRNQYPTYLELELQK